MTKQSYQAFYDPLKTYDDNFDDGPEDIFNNADLSSNRGEPSFSVLGKKVYSPFGIPAGPLLNSKYIKYAFERGFDVVHYKTQRSVEFKSNAFPNVLYLDIKGDLTLDKATKPLLGESKTSLPKSKLSITNSFGNPSRGPDFWVPDIKKALSYQRKGQILIASVVGTIQEGFSSNDYYDDFAKAAELAAQTGVSAIELNLSCPNVASEGILCYTPEAVLAICRKTKNKIGNTPLIAKLGYFSDKQYDLLRRIIKETTPYIGGYAAINTISAPIVDKNGDQALPGPNRLNSGVCGHAVKWAGLDMVKKLKRLREELDHDYQIFGVGGVMNPNDFHQYLKAGADVIQSATAAMWNPKLAKEIKDTL